MYEVKFDSEDNLFWIVKDGEKLRSIGGFIEPITPKIIIKEIEDG